MVSKEETRTGRSSLLTRFSLWTCSIYPSVSHEISKAHFVLKHACVFRLFVYDWYFVDYLKLEFQWRNHYIYSPPLKKSHFFPLLQRALILVNTEAIFNPPCLKATKGPRFGLMICCVISHHSQVQSHQRQCKRPQILKFLFMAHCRSPLPW